MLRLNPTQQDVLRIALPVGLESVYQIGLGLLNQVIVGLLGTVAIAAVGLANNVLFIGILCLNTLGFGCAILLSRALGRQDQVAAGQIISFSLLFAVGLALILSLPLALGAQAFLTAVSTNSEIANLGGRYLSYYALSLPFITVSVVCSAVFRAIGRPRIPMLVTMSALSVGPLLAWLLVFPLQLGVEGAALGLLLAQSLRATLLLGLLFFSRYGVSWHWVSRAYFATLLAQMVPLVLPLFVTEVVFSGGSFIFALLVERLGTEALAVFQITSAIEMIFITMAMGFTNAATILVGQAIGRANPQEVWTNANTVWRMAMLVGVGLGLLLALTALVVPLLYPNTTPQVKDWTVLAIVLSALFIPVRSGNMVFFGVLASGGDTRFLLWSDVVTVVLVGLPLAYLLAFPLEMGIWGVFLGRLLGEETVRLAMLMWRYRQGRWFKLA